MTYIRILNPVPRFIATVRRGATALSYLVALIAVLPASPMASFASPAQSILDLLQLGTRSDLALGGDPFVSTARGAAGWWIHPVLDDPGSLQLRSDQYRPVTDRLTGGDARVEFVAASLSLRKQWSPPGRRFQVGAKATSLQTTATARGGIAAATLEQRGPSVSGVLRAEDVLPGLDLQMGAPIVRGGSRRSGASFQFGYRLAVADRLFLTSARSLWDSQELIHLVLDDEVVNSPLNLQSTTTQHGARLEPGWGIAFEVAFREGIHADADQLAGSDWEFLPDAKTFFRQQTLEWGPTEALRGLIRFTGMEVSGRGAGYWDGQRYARVHDVRSKMRTTLIAVEFRPNPDQRVLADSEFGTFDGFGRAAVDSWRFASWNEAWTGALKILQITGEGSWERYHLAFEHNQNAWHLSGGLSYFDIHPDLLVESWIQQVFLPRIDEEASRPLSDHLSLGAVSFGVQRQFDNLSLEVGLTQFVYGSDHRKVDPHGSGGGVPPATDAEEGHGWYGGTFASLALGYEF